MHTLHVRPFLFIVVLSAVLCLFWVLATSSHPGPPTVNVMVTNGDKMDQYFHGVGELHFTIQGGAGGGEQYVAGVPDGKRLVIEHVSFHAAMPTGQRILSAHITDWTNYNQYLIPVFQGSTNASPVYDHYTASQAIRQRVVSGKNVCLEVLLNSFDGGAIVTWGLSGYFVDYP